MAINYDVNFSDDAGCCKNFLGLVEGGVRNGAAIERPRVTLFRSVTDSCFC